MLAFDLGGGWVVDDILGSLAYVSSFFCVNGHEHDFFTISLPPISKFFLWNATGDKKVYEAEARAWIMRLIISFHFVSSIQQPGRPNLAQNQQGPSSGTDHCSARQSRALLDCSQMLARTPLSFSASYSRCQTSLALPNPHRDRDDHCSFLSWYLFCRSYSPIHASLAITVHQLPPRSASTKCRVAPPSRAYSSAVLSSALKRG